MAIKRRRSRESPTQELRLRASSTESLVSINWRCKDKMGAFFISKRKTKASKKARSSTIKDISGSDLNSGMKPLPEGYIPQKNDVIMGRGKVSGHFNGIARVQNDVLSCCCCPACRRYKDTRGISSTVKRSSTIFLTMSGQSAS